MKTNTKSLFDCPAIWLSSPAEAFNSFILTPAFSSRVIRDKSAKVYQAMFGKFLASRHSHGFPLVTADNIREFLDENGLVSGIRRRYVRLLERVFDHLFEQGVVTCNPARGLAMKDRPQPNQPTAFLSAAEQQAFIQSLPEPTSWKRRRDRAMLMAILGGGFRVSEVINLEVAHVGRRDLDGSIPVRVYPGGAGRWHTTRILDFAADEVLGWLAHRAEMAAAGGIRGKLLFPGNEGGTALNAATVFRHVKRVFEQAGLNPTRRGGRTLRNSFAIQQLAAGKPVELVGEFMGHRMERSTLHYAGMARRFR